MEGLSDAVLGFALTLLVVSLEVPTSVEALEGLSIALVFLFPGEPACAGLVNVPMAALHGWNGSRAFRAQAALHAGSHANA